MITTADPQPHAAGRAGGGAPGARARPPVPPPRPPQGQRTGKILIVVYVCLFLSHDTVHINSLSPHPIPLTHTTITITHQLITHKQDNPLPWLPLPAWQAVQALCDSVDGFAKFGQVCVWASERDGVVVV